MGQSVNSKMTHALVRHSHRPNCGGFTLIELLLVLVILATLAAIVVPKFTKRSEQARTTAAGTDIANIELALDAFEVDCGRYPTAEEGLRALVEQPSNANGWKGPYLKKALPKDPWGNQYVYRCPGQHNTNGCDLYSFGPDGQDGGGDDIDNWSQE
jgi:general secretion pathway protein G